MVSQLMLVYIDNGCIPFETNGVGDDEDSWGYDGMARSYCILVERFPVLSAVIAFAETILPTFVQVVLPIQKQ